MHDSQPYGQDSGRDDFIFKLCAQGATYNLSPKKIYDVIWHKVYNNPLVISDLKGIDYDSYLETKVESAYQYIQNLRRENERSIDSTVQPYERDEFGYPIITRDQYESKVEYISKRNFSAFDPTDTMTLLFCETVIQFGDSYYVPHKRSETAYRREYENSLLREENDNENIDVRKQLHNLSETKITWGRYSQNEFNARYRVRAGSITKPLINQLVFLEHVIKPKQLKESKNTSTLMLEDGIFYMHKKHRSNH